jgi:hypothetical protein
VRTHLLLAGILALILLPTPADAGAPVESELDGLVAIMGELREVDVASRVVVVDRYTVQVPASVKGFDGLRAGQRVVVRLDPDTEVWTATAIDVLP